MQELAEYNTSWRRSCAFWWNDFWFIWPPMIFLSLLLDLDQNRVLWSKCWKFERIWTVINILQLARSAYEWAPLENLAPTIKWFRDLIARQRGIVSSYFCGNQGNFRSWIQVVEHTEITDADLGLQWALHNKKPQTSNGEKLMRENGCNHGHWWKCSGRHCAARENKLYKCKGARSNSIT